MLLNKYNQIIKEGCRYIAEDCSSVVISDIVKEYLHQSPSMQLWIEDLHRQHHQEFRKILRRSPPISYYANTSATQRILLGTSYIETNPGQTSTTNWGSTPRSDKQNSNKATAKRNAPIRSICGKTVHIYAFTQYKHKITNNFRRQKCERLDLFFLCFNWATVSQSARWIKH